MRARTTLLIVSVAIAFMLAAVSHGFAAQTTPEQRPGYEQNQPNQPGNNSNFSNDLSNSANPQSGVAPNDQQDQSRDNSNTGTSAAGSPYATPGGAPQSGITPGVGNTQQPVAARHVGWGWLLLGAVIGFVIGAITMGPRRRYGTVEDIRRNRAA